MSLADELLADLEEEEDLQKAEIVGEIGERNEDVSALGGNPSDGIQPMEQGM